MKKKNYTEKELGQIFENNFDCYADTTDGSVVMAMSKEKYLEVLKEFKILNKHFVSNSEVAVCCHDWKIRTGGARLPSKKCKKCGEVR